jgi:hypothetical protein
VSVDEMPGQEIEPVRLGIGGTPFAAFATSAFAAPLASESASSPRRAVRSSFTTD